MPKKMPKSAAFSVNSAMVESAGTYGGYSCPGASSTYASGESPAAGGLSFFGIAAPVRLLRPSLPSPPRKRKCRPGTPGGMSSCGPDDPQPFSVRTPAVRDPPRRARCARRGAGHEAGCYYILCPRVNDVQDMHGSRDPEKHPEPPVTDSYPVSRTNKVRQLQRKARYDRETVGRILAAGVVAHVGFVQDGAPVVVPMIYGLDGDTLYLHGARKARVIRLLEQTERACVNVTLVDALVLARSSFNSSLNYRSVTVFGAPR